MNRMVLPMVEIGQKVKFDPFDCLKGYGVEMAHREVTGTVVSVNEKHRWFSVEYGKDKARISFHFSEIGKKVKICGKKNKAD